MATTTTPNAMTTNNNKTTSVLIIGAGVAGLSATAELLRQGVSVRLLEAQAVHGGRVRTLSDVCELGATWLHGSTRNELFSYALARGLLDGSQRYMGVLPKVNLLDSSDEEGGENHYLYSDHDGEIILLPGGRVVDPAIASAVMQTVGQSLRACAAPDTLSLNPSENVLDRVRNEFKGGAGQGCSPALARSLFEVRHCDESLYTGAAGAQRLSLCGYKCYDIMDGVDLPPPSGFGPIIDALAADAGVHNIHYNQRVVSMRQTLGGVEVVCASGAVYTAQVVICTVSLGVLKSWTAAHPAPSCCTIHPPLSTTKVSAIQRLGFGRVEKVHLEFHSFWWRDLWKRVQIQRQRGGAAQPFLPSSEPCGGIIFAWDAERVWASSATSEYGASSRTLPPLFEGFQPWMAQVYGAFEDASPRPSQSPRLTFWLYGDAVECVDPAMATSTSAAQRLSNDELTDALLRIIRYFLPHGDSCNDSIDGAAAAAAAEEDGIVGVITAPTELPRVRRVIRSSWGSDPLFRGSYSYIATGSTVDDIEALSQPAWGDNDIRPDESGTAAAVAPTVAVVHCDSSDLARVAVTAPPPSASAVAKTAGHLLFAGEATHPRFYSTTHAAYTSGRREAARAISILNGGK